MALMFSDDDLDMMRKVKSVFDPRGAFNPGKVLPTGKRWGELHIQVSSGESM